MSAFGNNLKRLRRERGITLGIIAERTGISIASLSCYEHGSRNPRDDNAERIAAVLGVNVCEMSEDVKPVSTAPPHCAYPEPPAMPLMMRQEQDGRLLDIIQRQQEHIDQLQRQVEKQTDQLTTKPTNEAAGGAGHGGHARAARAG